MPQLRIARADTPSHPAEQAYVVFSSSEAAGGQPKDWLIGRGSDYRMCIADGSVSRPHVQVLFQGGVFHLRNLSQHGSEIGGKRVVLTDPPVTVTGNLSVKLGDVQLRCTLLPDSEAIPAASPAASRSGFEALPASQPITAELPSVNWWSDGAAPAGSAGSGFEVSGVPSVDDWYVDASGAAQHGVDRRIEVFGAEPGGPLDAVPFGAASADSGPFGVDAFDVAPFGAEAFGNDPLAGEPFGSEPFGAAVLDAGFPAAAPGDAPDWAAPFNAPPAPVAAPVAVSPKDAMPAPPVRASESVDGAAAVARILESAGVRADVAALHAKDCSPEQVGALLSQLLAGLIAVLATRRSIKNTLRVAHTEVRVEGNNPLKHAVTPVEALLGLIQGERPGYLVADRAVHEVFKDLADHELALVEGVEEALKHVVALVSPDAVEAALEQATPRSGMGWLGGQGARAWTLYRTRFSDLFGDGRVFAGHFLPAFRDAYDACLAKLRRARGKGSSGK